MYRKDKEENRGGFRCKAAKNHPWKKVQFVQAQKKLYKDDKSIRIKNIIREFNEKRRFIISEALRKRFDKNA